MTSVAAKFRTKSRDTSSCSRKVWM